MKRVPRLRDEPPELAAYRAAHPGDDVAPAEESGAVWERFRNEPDYGCVRDALVGAQQGLCGWCEQRLTRGDGGLELLDQQIEHVRPKSGGRGRTLEWTNLMLACAGGTRRELARRPREEGRTRVDLKPGENTSCGQTKGNREVLCDPRTFPAQPRLTRVDLDGTLRVERGACAAAGVDPDALERTINDVLKLNCERLRYAREHIVSEVMLGLEAFRIEPAALDWAGLQTSALEVYGPEIAANRLQPDAHGHLRRFWSVERQYLEPWSEVWIAEHHERLNFA